MKPIMCLIRLVQMYRIEAEQIKIRITTIFQRSILDLCPTSLHGARCVLQDLCFPKGFRERIPDGRQQEAQEHFHVVIVFAYWDTHTWVSIGFQSFAVPNTLFVICWGGDRGKLSLRVKINSFNQALSLVQVNGHWRMLQLGLVRDRVKRDYPFPSIVDR